MNKINFIPNRIYYYINNINIPLLRIISNGHEININNVKLKYVSVDTYILSKEIVDYYKFQLLSPLVKNRIIELTKPHIVNIVEFDELIFNINDLY